MTYSAIPAKQPMFTVLRALPIPTSLMRHLRFTGTIIVEADTGVKFKMHNNASYVENDLFWRGFGNSFEAVSLQVWRRLVRNSECILDVGANTGVYCLSAQALVPTAIVIAFEPCGEVHDQLVQNIHLNGFDLLAEKAAVSDHTGFSTLYAPGGDYPFFSSLETPQSVPGLLAKDELVVKVEVPCYSLDDYCTQKSLPKIDLVKIDIEGHEPAALRGFTGRLRRDQPALLIEVLSNEIGEDVWSSVSQLSYLVFHIDEKRGLVRDTTLSGYEGQHRNYLLCSQEDFEKARLSDFIAR